MVAIPGTCASDGRLSSTELCRSTQAPDIVRGEVAYQHGLRCIDAKLLKVASRSFMAQPSVNWAVGDPAPDTKGGCDLPTLEFEQVVSWTARAASILTLLPRSKWRQIANAILSGGRASALHNRHNFVLRSGRSEELR